ncbi:MAG: SDR family oxidoreductase [Cyanobacteria bacterium]|nr:SDR family oxidoreductase [Cyanobacteriota bacterium]
MRNSQRPQPSHNIVLISGASTGIGLASALHLNHHGYTVFAGVRSNEDALRIKAEAQYPEAFFPVLLDITQAEDISRVTVEIESWLQRFPESSLSLINNAGVVVSGPMEFIPVSKLKSQFDINVFGHIALTQSVLPLIRRNQSGKNRGKIVMISSISGLHVTPFVGPYAASKFALEAFSDALRQELYPWNIPVVLVEPGSIQTPLWKKAKSTAAELLSEYPAEAIPLYQRAYELMQKASAEAEAGGISVEPVAILIHHILSAPKPKSRYLIGRETQFIPLLRFLPDSWLDSLLRHKIGL